MHISLSTPLCIELLWSIVEILGEGEGMEESLSQGTDKSDSCEAPPPVFTLDLGLFTQAIVSKKYVFVNQFSHYKNMNLNILLIQIFI